MVLYNPLAQCCCCASASWSLPGKRGNRPSGIVTKPDMSGKRLLKFKERWKDSAGEAVQDVAGALEFGEALLFFAKFAGMRNHAAT